MLRIFLSSSVFVLLFSGFTVSTGPLAEDTSLKAGSDEVTVYYFHFSRRCATCMAVEEETQSSLKDLYPAQVANGSVVFLSVNLDKPDNKPLADQLKVSGQTLLVVKGDKQVDLTNQAFMYARTKPDKLKAEIQSAFRQVQ
jgi:hypothetical protein